MRRHLAATLVTALLVPALLLGVLGRAAEAVTVDTWKAATITGDNVQDLEIGGVGIDSSPSCAFDFRYRNYSGLGDVSVNAEVRGKCTWLFGLINDPLESITLTGLNGGTGLPCSVVTTGYTQVDSGSWYNPLDVATFSGTGSAFSTGCDVTAGKVRWNSSPFDLEVTFTVDLGEVEEAALPVTSGNCGSLTINALEVHYARIDSGTSYKVKPTWHLRATVPSAGTWGMGSLSPKYLFPIGPGVLGSATVQFDGGQAATQVGDFFHGTTTAVTTEAATVDFYWRGTAISGGYSGNILRPSDAANVAAIPESYFDNAIKPGTSGDAASHYVRIYRSTASSAPGAWDADGFSGDTISCTIFLNATGVSDPQNVSPGGGGTVGVPDPDDPDSTTGVPVEEGDAAIDGRCTFSWTDPTTWASGGICQLVALVQRMIGWLRTIAGYIAAIPSSILGGLSALFVPDPTNIQTRFGEVKTAFDASGPGEWGSAVGDTVGAVSSLGSSGAGCGGPVLAGSLGGASYDLAPLDACTAPMSTVANVVKVALSLMVAVGGVLAAAHPLASSLGLSLREPKA